MPIYKWPFRDELQLPVGGVSKKERKMRRKRGRRRDTKSQIFLFYFFLLSFVDSLQHVSHADVARCKEADHNKLELNRRAKLLSESITGFIPKNKSWSLQVLSWLSLSEVDLKGDRPCAAVHTSHICGSHSDSEITHKKS